MVGNREYWEEQIAHESTEVIERHMRRNEWAIPAGLLVSSGLGLTAVWSVLNEHQAATFITAATSTYVALRAGLAVEVNSMRRNELSQRREIEG